MKVLQPKQMISRQMHINFIETICLIEREIALPTWLSIPLYFACCIQMELQEKMSDFIQVFQMYLWVRHYSHNRQMHS